jgi:hypothetical protein
MSECRRMTNKKELMGNSRPRQVFHKLLILFDCFKFGFIGVLQNIDLSARVLPHPPAGGSSLPEGALGARGKITYRATDFRGARYEAPSGRGLREAVGEPAHVWVMVFFCFLNAPKNCNLKN